MAEMFTDLPVRVTSDGTFFGSHISVGGQELAVRRAVIRIEPEELVTAVLEMDYVELEVVADHNDAGAPVFEQLFLDRYGDVECRDADRCVPPRLLELAGLV